MSFQSRGQRRRGQLTAEFLLVGLSVVVFAVIVISITHANLITPARNQTSLTANTSLCLTQGLTCNRTCVDACSGTTRLYNNSCSCGTCVHRQSQSCATACSYGVCS